MCFFFSKVGKFDGTPSPQVKLGFLCISLILVTYPVVPPSGINPVNKEFRAERLFNRLHKSLCLVSFSIAGFVFLPSIAFAALPVGISAGTAIGSDTDFIKSVALGDVDNDGDLDVVVGNGNTFGSSYNSRGRLYLNDGSGGFIESCTLPGESSTGLCSTADGTKTSEDSHFIMLI